MKTSTNIPVKLVIGFPVSCVPFEQQIDCILNWASDRLSKFVCVANVHMLIEAHRTNLDAVLHNADLVTPDGMPLVWMLRWLGARKQDRVAGLEIFKAVCGAAQQRNMSVFLLGSQSSILDQMRKKLEQEFPELKIAALEPLPFRPLTPREDEDLVQRINHSGANIVFVSLGCPKQEHWMYQHKDKVNAVMIGLGGAFPMYAGIHKRAPLWMQKIGFEWLYRLIQEPRRLWGRYASTIPHFIWLAFKQIFGTFVFKNRELLKEQ